ncbi:MAG: quinone-dependent dihydroorotate dehydrogenase [Flavobacteriales bacterium]|nr:quinone-dependent dihydroorotate dehydrogenase [Flavobacteriales bacterium]PWM12488.1 MAG: dihydroorotate dehydrogenase (quinone) [Flavobacteriales bacterium]
MYKTFIRPLLFRMNPERAHAFTFSCLKALQKMPFGLALASLFFRKKDPRLEREVFGIKFPSPVGVAAGLDKDAEVPDALGALGFSFVEIGTVTPEPQPGNPSPRLFRLPEDKALINRMGFNNQGAKAAAGRLAKRRTRVIVGGNIGKNKVTPNAQATSDYLKCYDALYPYVDYFAVNVSSPNTPGLRELQDKEPLEALLTALQKKNASMPAAKPVLLKIAPDLTDDQLDDIIEIVGNTGIAGVIATNTTVSREMILSTRADKVEAMGAGGLSGMPLSERSTEVIRYLHERSGGRFPIIGVGGIMSPDDALEKLDAGASLVQVYTGFIYEGPAFVKSINKAILKASKEA